MKNKQNKVNQDQNQHGTRKKYIYKTKPNKRFKLKVKNKSSYKPVQIKPYNNRSNRNFTNI